MVYLFSLKTLKCAPNYANQKESQSEHSIFRNAPPTLAYELTWQAGEVGVIILVLWMEETEEGACNDLPKVGSRLAKCRVNTMLKTIALGFVS